MIATARERGFTVVEAMVAAALVAVGLAAILTLYEGVRRSFISGQSAAALQQGTRVALERVVADLRLAGFNHNPDGAPTRPDEAIEGMWETAVTVRADFDFADPAERLDPEALLGGEGMTFRVVSTGNDEIVTWALAKPAGSGGGTLGFTADVQGTPRNGSLENVAIDNVHTTHDDPPYTLYRFLVSPSGGVVRQPVADNIHALSLSYYDRRGAILPPAGGADSAGAPAQRRRIFRVRVRITGVAEEEDPSYFDPADGRPATRRRRKLTLETDVTLRNQGLTGGSDILPDDPGNPASHALLADPRENGSRSRIDPLHSGTLSPAL